MTSGFFSILTAQAEVAIPPQNLRFQCQNCYVTGAERVLSKKIHRNFVLYCNCSRTGKALYESHRSVLLSERQAPRAAFMLLQRWRTASWLSIQQKYSVEEGNVRFLILVVRSVHAGHKKDPLIIALLPIKRSFLTPS